MVGVLVTLFGVGSFPVPWPVNYFPGRFYDTRGPAVVERIVRERWPSPQALAEVGWRRGARRRRIAWLLGAAYFHDPVVLPAYAQALEDDDPLIRLAGLYGLTTFTGADPPRARSVTLEDGRRLAAAVRDLVQVLRRRPLAGLWLDALLAAEGGHAREGATPLVGGRVAECLRALDRTVDAGDLGLVVSVYRRARTEEVRSALLRIVEGLTCTRFVVLPRGPRAGWGERNFRRGLDLFEAWLGARCELDEAREVRSNLGRLGVTGFDPYARQACDVWVQVLQRGPDVFRPLASRQLIRCGAPPWRISFFDRDGRLARAHRNRLLWFFGYGKVKASRRTVVPRARRRSRGGG